MKKRKIIKILEDKCDGCGLCIPNCPEGALRIEDGKARLVREPLCDGLGACLGACPRGAILIEERSAAAYSESDVMAELYSKGESVVQTHIKHLEEHGEIEALKEAKAFMKDKKIKSSPKTIGCASGEKPSASRCGCPGAQEMDIRSRPLSSRGVGGVSCLRQWPVQLRLVSPAAPYFKKADVVLAADCVAYACGSFHADHISGKAIAIACPKLDVDQEEYLEKISGLIEDAQINTLTVITMEVPCCNGLLNMVQLVLRESKRKVPVKHSIIGIDGSVKNEEWLDI